MPSLAAARCCYATAFARYAYYATTDTLMMLSLPLFCHLYAHAAADATLIFDMLLMLFTPYAMMQRATTYALAQRARCATLLTRDAMPYTRYAPCADGACYASVALRQRYMLAR